MADWIGVDVTDRTCTVEGCGKPYQARGFCRAHYDKARQAGELSSLRTSVTPQKLFMAKVRMTGSGCWEWTATINQDGYGLFKLNRRLMGAHRAAYILFIGPIPEGLDIDHVCHTQDVSCTAAKDCPHRRCVNPEHLEAVTERENILRARGFAAGNRAKTHCINGHPFDAANTIITKVGRQCRACGRDRMRVYSARKAAVRAAE